MNDMARTTEAIERAIQGAFAGMDSRGFFPAQPCKKCGAALQGADSGRPAELYAGTYTGLCYPCMNGSAFLLETDVVTGVQTWSHPPHCPAWRRDRETFLWFPDCSNTKCEHGHVYVSRSDGAGGSYYVQCEPCGKRHWEHPVKVAEEECRKRLSAAHTAWALRMNAEFILRMERAGLPRKRGEGTPEQDAAADKLRETIFAEGPKEPSDPDVLLVFPEGWAPAPEAKKARKRKS